MTDEDARYSPYYSSSWALVIGINDYHHLPPLYYAAHDAGSVAETLSTRFAFPHNQVILLQDELATQNNILSVFDLIINQRNVSIDDRIMIYFAGHGLTRATRDGATVGYIAPVDVEPRAWRTLIRMTDLIEQASFLPAKHILFIMDACYSGLSLRRGAMIDPLVEHFMTHRAVQVMTAGRADEMVTDGGDREGDNSVFTGYLLEALTGKAAGASGLMTASDVMRYVFRHVTESPYTEQTPQYDWIEGKGDFVFQMPQGTELPLSIERDSWNERYDQPTISAEDRAVFTSDRRNPSSALAVRRPPDVGLTRRETRHTNSALAAPLLEVFPPHRLAARARVDVTPALDASPSAPAFRIATKAAPPRITSWLNWMLGGTLAVVAITGALLVWTWAGSVRGTRSAQRPDYSTQTSASPTATSDVGTSPAQPTPPLMATLLSNETVMFHDDFSDSLNAWEPLEDRERISRLVTGSQMEFTVYSPYGLWITRPRDLSVGNIRVNVDVTLLAAEADTAYGVVFRQVDYDNYYYYRITPDGQFSLILQRNGTIGYLVEPQPLERSQTIGVPHQLGVEMAGSTISLYFNNELIAAVQDSSFGSGRLGLAVQTGEAAPIGVAFDNFGVFAR